MTALAAGRVTKFRDDRGEIMPYAVAANAKIYDGGWVCKKKADGYSQAGANTLGLEVQGIAEETKDATGLADGALDVLVRTHGVVRMPSSGLAQANVGVPLYLTDDQTVTMTVTNVPIPRSKLLKVISATEAEFYFDARQGRRRKSYCFPFPTIATTPGTSVSTQMEFPVPTRVDRIYWGVGTAPGGSDTAIFSMTDGTTTKSVTITGTATEAKNEAVDGDFLPNTALTINAVRTGAAAANGLAIVEVTELE